MESFANLAAQLANDDELRAESAVVEAVRSELQVSPSSLATATAEWEDPYLVLRFTHEDGTVLSVTHGDGYTAVSGGGVDYKGYLDTSSLIEVLAGTFHGRVNYVRQTCFGYEVDEYFELVGREEQRLGYSRALGIVSSLLRLVPLLPKSIHRRRLSFESTPAVADS